MIPATFKVWAPRLLAAAACAPGPNLAAQPAFIPLGDLPGGDFASYAWAISDDGGTVVGMSFSLPLSPQNEAFRWTEETGMVGLGYLPGAPTPVSNAYGVSADGSIIVGHSRNADDAREAFIWTEPTGMVGLGFLPGPKLISEAFAVSDDGRVVVGREWIAWEAFIWTPKDGMKGLGDLPGGVFNSNAKAISADGRTIFGYGHDALGARAAMWKDGKDPVPLPLPAFAAWAGSANGLWAAGSAGSPNSSGEAFRWSERTGTMPLPSGAILSAGLGVTDDGRRIVGGRADDPPWGNAFLWDPVMGMRKLTDVLVEDYGLDLLNWKKIDRANAITPDGTAISGAGFNALGQREAFLARIPPFCYADCDRSSGMGVLDIDDFLCFQLRFATSDMLYADCNQDGELTIDDFLCFQLAFAMGCG